MLSFFSSNRSYLLSSVLDDFEVFLLSFVSKLLVDSETSPFYQSLLCSNLGADFSPNTGFDNNAKDTSFAVGLQGVAVEDADEVLRIIDKTWEQVVENGFDDQDVDAILHKVELQVFLTPKDASRLDHRIFYRFRRDTLSSQSCSSRKSALIALG